MLSGSFRTRRAKKWIKWKGRPLLRANASSQLRPSSWSLFWRIRHFCLFIQDDLLRCPRAPCTCQNFYFVTGVLCRWLMQENISRKRLNLCSQTRTGPWQSSASPQVISRQTHAPRPEIDKNSLGAFLACVCARVLAVKTGSPICPPSVYVTQGCER